MEQAAPAQANPGPAQAGGGRRQRHWRNFLLDARFQLKYAGFLVITTVLLSALLGSVLWQTSQEVIDQSQRSVRMGEELVHHGQRVLTESKKVKAVVEMNIIKDPVYADNPALLEAFQSDARKHDDSLAEQQSQLEQNARMLQAQSEGLARQQRNFGFALVAILALLVVGVGLAGIVVTHKVAGPVFKMKRQLGDLAGGNWRVPSPLRKGDELMHFFDAFNDMVQSLRARQQEELVKLDSAIESLQRASVNEQAMEPLKNLRAHMQAPLDG